MFASQPFPNADIRVRVALPPPPYAFDFCLREGAASLRRRQAGRARHGRSGGGAQSVIERHQDQAAAANIELALKCDRPVDTIESDRGRLEQILSNLVSNAIDFGRPNGNVTVTVSEDRDYVRFDVAGDGIGMRKEDMPLAIAPFSQIDDTVAGSVDGTGLGLPLSLQLAHLLGGELKIANTPGAGTTVTLWLTKADRPLTVSLSAEPAAA